MADDAPRDDAEELATYLARLRSDPDFANSEISKNGTPELRKRWKAVNDRIALLSKLEEIAPGRGKGDGENANAFAAMRVFKASGLPPSEFEKLSNGARLLYLEDALASDAAQPDPSASLQESENPDLKPPSGFLGGASLADALGVHASRKQAFLKKLERMRLSLGDDCWLEVANPQPNALTYLYRADAPVLRKLAAKYGTPKPA